MTETAVSIRLWADEAFGPAPSAARIIGRAYEEYAEAIRALTVGEGSDAVARELTDAVIVLARLPDVGLPVDYCTGIDAVSAIVQAGMRLTWSVEWALIDHPLHVHEASKASAWMWRAIQLLGHDPQELIDEKMAINRQREWRRDGTGHGYHVRDKAHG